MFDLRLFISPFELALVGEFVVLGVHYATIIISKARQTRLVSLCSLEVNNQLDKNKVLVLGLLDYTYLSYSSFVLLWLFAL